MAATELTGLDRHGRIERYVMLDALELFLANLASVVGSQDSPCELIGPHAGDNLNDLLLNSDSLRFTTQDELWSEFLSAPESEHGPQEHGINARSALLVARIAQAVAHAERHQGFLTRMSERFCAIADEHIRKVCETRDA